MGVPGARHQAPRQEARPSLRVEFRRVRDQSGQVQLGALNRCHDHRRGARQPRGRHFDPLSTRQAPRRRGRPRQIPRARPGWQNSPAATASRIPPRPCRKIGMTGSGRARGAGRVVRIRALEHIIGDRQIFDRTCERAAEHRGSPQTAAFRRGSTGRRSAAVRTRRKVPPAPGSSHWCQSRGSAAPRRCNRRRRAARRAASDARGIMRIARGAVMGVLGRKAVGVFVHVQRTHHHRSAARPAGEPVQHHARPVRDCGRCANRRRSRHRRCRKGS